MSFFWNLVYVVQILLSLLYITLIIALIRKYMVTLGNSRIRTWYAALAISIILQRYLVFLIWSPHIVPLLALLTEYADLSNTTDGKITTGYGDLFLAQIAMQM